MAQSLDLEGRMCLVWKTDKPYLDKLQKSSDFSVLDSQWNLQLAYYSPGTRNFEPYYKYKLSLSQGTEIKTLKASLQFSVSTFIENHNNQPVLGQCKKIQTTNVILFDYEKSTMYKSLPSLDDYGEMKIMCVFHGFSSSTLHPKNETIRLSTQVVMVSPRAFRLLPAEKGVQACKYIPPDLESLSLDLCNLLEKKVFPDVKLKCGDRTIPVHRSILAARSEVFAAMFRNEMVESETGVVDVTDLDAPVLDLLLKYVYSGRIPDLSDDTACNLYGAGDKYAIHALKKACSEWMIGNLSEDNYVSFFTSADAHNDADFKDAVVSFICGNSTVLRSETWLEFAEEHPKLANHVYQRFVVSLSE